VYDAIRVRIDEVPITPDKVLAALRSPSRRHGPDAFPAVPWPEPLQVAPPWEGGDGTARDPRREGGRRREAEP
jgi:hypothetical protein